MYNMNGKYDFECTYVWEILRVKGNRFYKSLFQGLSTLN